MLTMQLQYRITNHPDGSRGIVQPSANRLFGLEPTGTWEEEVGQVTVR